MIAGLACLCLLWLPGRALLLWLRADEPESGVLGVVARSYAASLALLSPLSLLGYALHAPLALFSAGLALALLAGLVVCVRERRRLLVRLEPYEWIGLAGLVLHLWMQARVGGWLDGDATFHVARIRVLIEHGFSNRDIYLDEELFHQVYHSNLVYPLYASFAQLTGQPFLDTWFWMLPFAKLASFAAHGYLGFAVSGKRWVGWAAALLIEAARAPETYTLYPNGLGAGFLVPLSLAVAIGAPQRRGAALELGALSFVLGQVHGLYAVYAALCAGAALLLQLVLDGARTRRTLVTCGLALLLAAPFLITSRFLFRAGPDVAARLAPPEPNLPPQPPPRVRPDKPPESGALAAGGGNLEKELDARPDGSFVMRPEQMGGLVPLLVGLLALFACIALDGARRRQWLVLGAVTALLAGVLFVPALCTLSEHLLGEPFMVARLSTLLATALFTATAGALGVALVRTHAGNVTQALGLCGCAVLGAQLLGHAPRSFADHAQAALHGTSETRALLVEHSARRRLLTLHVRPGSTVLATPRFARYVAMVFDARAIAVDRGHALAPGIGRRRWEATLLTQRRTEPALRYALLHKHRIRWVAYREQDQSKHAWAERLGKPSGQAGGLHLVDLGERFER